MTPYYADDSVTLYLGDCRDVLRQMPLSQKFDCAIVDPPYVATSHNWDRVWQYGWADRVGDHTKSMWCFGNLRMFGTYWDDIACNGWKLSHDTVADFEIDTAVWEKHNGTGFAKDRFRGVHELAAHWYQGRWSDIYHEVPRGAAVYKRGGAVTRNGQPSHTGAIGDATWIDDGTRLARSVLRAPSVRRGMHGTQKPQPILDHLIRYASPLGGTVLAPFGGSDSVATAARLSGRRCVVIERDRDQCEAIAGQLGRVLPMGAS